MAKIVARCDCDGCSWGPVERDATARNSPEKRLQTKADRHERMTGDSEVWDGSHRVSIELEQ